MNQPSFILPFAGMLVLGAATGAGAIEAFPRAEQLVLNHTWTLLPDAEQVAEVQADLELIEASFPVLEGYPVVPKWAPGQLLLGLEDEAAAIYETGGTVPELEDLTAEYGGTVIKGKGYFLLKFDKNYNPEVLGPIFEVLDVVEYTSPNGIFGDGGTITWLSEDNLYVYRKAWGDCPAGCIYSEYRYFVVAEGAVTELSQEDASAWAGLEIVSEPSSISLQSGESLALDLETVAPSELSLYVRWYRVQHPRLSWEMVAGGNVFEVDSVSNQHEGLYQATASDRLTGLFISSSPFYVQVDELDNKLWRTAWPMGGGWSATWMGAFYSIHNPWIFVDGEGWFYVAGTDESALLWNQSAGWLWTSSSDFPWVYSYDSAQWEAGL